MNYWERWVGDWKRKTAHLSFAEKGAYGELLDHLYANDTPTLPVAREAVYRIAGAQSHAERCAVDCVLAQFFILDDAGHHQKRAGEEIDKRRAYIENQRLMGKRRWEKQPAHKGNGEDKPQPQTAQLPDWMPADLWAAWWAAKPKRARTAKAAELGIRKLDELRAAGNDPTAILEHCIRSGYQGIFAPPAAARAQPQQAAINARCHYCAQPATKFTNDIPHCARLDHLDFALARRQ